MLIVCCFVAAVKKEVGSSREEAQQKMKERLQQMAQDKAAEEAAAKKVAEEAAAKKKAEEAAAKRAAEEAAAKKKAETDVIVAASAEAGGVAGDQPFGRTTRPEGAMIGDTAPIVVPGGASSRSSPVSPDGGREAQSSGPQGDRPRVVYRPRWRLLETASFRHPETCYEFVNWAVPPGERAFQRSRPRQELHATAVTCLANTFSVVAEMERELRSFRGEQSDLVKIKRTLDEEKAAFDEEKRQHGSVVRELKWKLMTEREKVEKAQAEIASLLDNQKRSAQEWQSSCKKTNIRIETLQNTNRELGSRVEVLGQELLDKNHALSTKNAEIAARDREIAELREKLTASENQRAELLQSVTGFEQQVAVMAGEMETGRKELEDLLEDRRWLVAEAMPAVVEIVKCGPEMEGVMAELLSSSKLAGREEDFAEGYACASAGKPATEFSFYGTDCAAAFQQKTEEFEDLHFPILDYIKSQADAGTLSALRAKFAELQDEEEEEQVDYEASG